MRNKQNIIETDRQAGRHAGKQTDRQKDRQTDRQADRQTNIPDRQLNVIIRHFANGSRGFPFINFSISNQC